MSAYPFASGPIVEETLDVLGTRNIATTQQTLLQQILVAIGTTGGGASAPDTPANFLAVAGDRAANLSWDNSTGATSYKVYQSITNDFGTATEVTGSPFATNSAELTFTDLEAGELYYFWVVASNDVGDSAPSTSVSARPFVTLASTVSANLTTPTGTWTFGTLLFAQVSTPTGLTINKDLVIREYDGVGWLNLDTFEYDDAVSISGAFTVINNSGSSYTFWNTEP